MNDWLEKKKFPQQEPKIMTYGIAFCKKSCRVVKGETFSLT